MKHLGIFVAIGLGMAGVASSASAERIYGMTAANSSGNTPGTGLVYFDSATPGSRTTVGNFTGVVAGHGVRSIDFRPANGQLYAISTTLTGPSAAQLYTVDLNNAALTAVGSGFSLGTNISAIVDIDFNPSVDRIRITTGGSGDASLNNPRPNNFRANPNDGTLVATDTAMDWASGDVSDGDPFRVVATAYSNNVAGATQTTLYAYEILSDSLVTVGGANGSPSPNGGELFTFDTSLSTAFNDSVGMDISATTGTLYITHDNNNVASGLYTRPLTGGPETRVGFYGTSVFISSIAVVIPEPGTGLIACALTSLLLRRRR